MVKRKTTEEFIQQARIAHGDKYDYSMTNYSGANSPITILCPIHGEFNKTAYGHKNGAGCPRCSGNSSKIENAWLDFLCIPREYRQTKIYDCANMYKVDAYDPITNIVYEFWGDYWHGNPKIFSAEKYNKNGRSFGELYTRTMKKKQSIIDAGYTLVDIWENDFNIIQIINGVIQTMKMTPENIARLKQLVKDGHQVLGEIDDLKAGLNETIRAIGEEMEIKPSIISRFIKDVQKNKINDRRDDNEIMEELIRVAGFE